MLVGKERHLNLQEGMCLAQNGSLDLIRTCLHQLKHI
jgi:hypothetical protein